jgi:hypothetical protein
MSYFADANDDTELIEFSIVKINFWRRKKLFRWQFCQMMRYVLDVFGFWLSFGWSRCHEQCPSCRCGWACRVGQTGKREVRGWVMRRVIKEKKGEVGIKPGVSFPLDQWWEAFSFLTCLSMTLLLWLGLEGSDGRNPQMWDDITDFHSQQSMTDDKGHWVWDLVYQK